MRGFWTMMRIEWRLSLRQMDGVFFGVLFPLGLLVFFGFLYGDRPAHEGAEYTLLQQAFAAVSLIGVAATGLMALPLTMADYREKGILRRYWVTPASPMRLLLVQILMNLGLALFSLLLLYLVARLAFRYQMLGGGLGFVAGYLLVALAIYGLGMVLASLAPSLRGANLLCSLVYFPMLFLSGTTIPYEIMPSGMQRMADLMPLTQGIKVLKGLSTGTGVDTLPLAFLTGLIILASLISLRFFRWE